MTYASDSVGPGLLYTWVDIDNFFKTVAIQGRWPTWLLEVDAYWDSAEFSIRKGLSGEQFWDWLRQNLGPLSVDQEKSTILLESADDEGRVLPVSVTEVDDVANFNPITRWTQKRVVPGLAAELPSPTGREFSGGVQVCAFHSFKGGVGRTLHCVALAHAIASQTHANGNRKHRVLLVDADLDAPGISWMIAAQGGRIDFAVEDFLALIHGTNDDVGRSSVMGLARRFLINQEHDGVVVLPAKRDLTRVEGSVIEPTDLLSPTRPPYFLTEAFAELAHAVGADTVILDLRAGNSELNSPILLDSRVHRVFVTTVSDQSVRGTISLLNELGRRAPSKHEDDPICKVIVTQFQENEHEAEVTAAAADLTDAISKSVRITAAEESAVDEGFDSIVDRDTISKLLTSPFDPQLLALPGTWEEVHNVIETAQIARSIENLTTSIFPDPQADASLAADGGIDAARVRLNSAANSLVFAETSAGDDDLLPTDALTTLVSTHRTEPPVEIVVGAKGSGKTYTYLRMCLKGNWQEFASLTAVRGVEVDAPIVPVLGSQYLSENLLQRVERAQDQAARLLGGGDPSHFLAVRDLIAESLQRDLNDVEWRHIWLTCLIRAVGIEESDPSDAERRLTDLARNHRAIFVLDGLEDLFQQFSTDERQQRALKVLLTSCPEWLRSLRGRPLGLVVFVRRDLVINAIRQNADQFLAKYQSSELRWNRTEALRLAAWVCERADALETFGVAARSASPKELSTLLVRLWGQKLGSRKSREARSEEWFLAALSDFKQQIQARDIVSFLTESSMIAVAEQRVSARWDDRLLPPTAMRRALPACSRGKIAALTQENEPVGKLLVQLSALNSAERRVPFTLESVGLSTHDARLLEINGVLFREDDQYWIPEIYRHGLDFAVSGVGRPRVLAVANLVRRRNDV